MTLYWTNAGLNLLRVCSRGWRQLRVTSQRSLRYGRVIRSALFMPQTINATCWCSSKPKAFLVHDRQHLRTCSGKVALCECAAVDCPTRQRGMLKHWNLKLVLRADVRFIRCLTALRCDPGLNSMLSVQPCTNIVRIAERTTTRILRSDLRCSLRSSSCLTLAKCELM